MSDTETRDARYETVRCPDCGQLIQGIDYGNPNSHALDCAGRGPFGMENRRMPAVVVRYPGGNT